MRSRPVVAIDGPSGAGEDHGVERLAEAAGLIRVDTGAMYRAVALAPNAPESLGRPGSSRRGGPGAGSFVPDRRGAPRVFLSGEDVSYALREPEMSMGASAVSAHGPVREALVAKQREMARDGGRRPRGAGHRHGRLPRRGGEVLPRRRGRRACRRRQLEISPPAASRSRSPARRPPARRAGQHAGALPLRVADGAVYIDSTTMTVDEGGGGDAPTPPGVPR